MPDWGAGLGAGFLTGFRVGFLLGLGAFGDVCKHERATSHGYLLIIDCLHQECGCENISYPYLARLPSGTNAEAWQQAQMCSGAMSTRTVPYVSDGGCELIYNDWNPPRTPRP